MVSRRQPVELDGCFDSRRRPIRPGAMVAYNLSGTIAYGEVVKILGYRRKSIYDKDMTIVDVSRIDVKYVAGAYGKKEGHISKVRHTNSVMRV